MRVKLFSALALLALLALLVMTFATPVLAFENREGGNITIGADEVVEDDLYLFADTATINGTIKGDLIFFGSVLTLNGTVEGDLMAAGQAIIINGTVGDDVRVGGAAILVGENAKIADDLLFGGASLETKAGSTIGGDVALGGAQGLLAGDVSGNLMVGAGGLELRGRVGGNVKAYVDSPEEGGPPPGMYLQQMPITIPSVPAGLTISSTAKIEGELEYTATKDLPIPAGIVAGEIQRVLPTVAEKAKEPTMAEKAGQWSLDLLRRIVALILVGLLMVWLLPALVTNLSEKVRTQVWPSLGWGVLAYAAFFFVLLLVFIVMILLAVIFGALTLGGLSAAVVFIGILALFALILGFVLTTSYLVMVVAGQLLGKLIFQAFKSDLAEHRVWPMVVGVILVAILVSLPYIGWLFKFIIIFFGLGALWLLGRQALAKPAAA